MKHAIYPHGFASSANGRKAQYLRPRFAALPDVTFHIFAFSPTPTDFEYLTITGMINRLRQHVLDCRLSTFHFIGSSMGGPVALNYAPPFWRGGAVAPAGVGPGLTFWRTFGLSLEQWCRQGGGKLFHYGFNRNTSLRYDLEVDGRFYQSPPPPPITIIHGNQDEDVPITGSRDYAARHSEQVLLIEVEADYDINTHLELIWPVAQRFLLAET